MIIIQFKLPTPVGYNKLNNVGIVGCSIQIFKFIIYSDYTRWFDLGLNAYY